MVIVVGGIGSVHDALVAAVLRERGIDARSLVTLDANTLALGRSLLPRGYPPPSYSLAGALVETVRRVRAKTPDAPILFVTVSGHCTHRASDYTGALDAAGLRGVTVLAPSMAGFVAPASATAKPFPMRALLDAVIVGDILVRLGCATRPLAASARAVDGFIAASVPSLSRAIVRGEVDEVLDDVASGLRGLKTRPDRAAVRVRITGEFVPSNSNGDVGARLVERIESFGAVAQPPLVTDWLLYVLWQLGPRFAALRQRIIARFQRRAKAAECVIAGPDDPADLAQLVAPLYSPDLRGGAGHLEAGIYFKVERHDLADLVVSVKAFASTASSSVSDAVIHALRRRSSTGFLAIESTGEGEAHIDSRLELAIDLARARRSARAEVTP